MTLRRTSLVGLGLFGALGLLVASGCTALLGDFRESAGSSASGAGTTGSGGASSSVGAGGGGGGTVVAPLFTCKWSNGMHQALGVSGDPSLQREDVRLAPRPGGARPRVLVSEWNQSTSTRRFGIFSLENGTGIYLDGLDRILDVQRLGDSSTGVLATYYDQQQQGIGIQMFVLPDSPDPLPVASVQSVKLITGNGWAADTRPDPSGGRFSGRFVVTSPASSGNTVWSVSYVLAYRATTGQYIATFGQSEVGSSPKRLFMLTPPGYGKTENDNEVVSMMHIPAKSDPNGKDTDYVYLGQSLQGGKAGEFTVGPATASSVTPRDFGASFLAGVIARPDGINAAFAALGNNVELRTHKLPFASLGKFTEKDVPLTVSLQGFGYLPVGQSNVAWFGDLFTFVGTQGQAPDSPIGWAFFDAASKERGHGTLPFTASLPSGVTRTGVKNVVIADSVSVQPNLLRTFDVAWLDGQQPAGGGTSFVLYSDRLECIASGG